MLCWQDRSMKNRNPSHTNLRCGKYQKAFRSSKMFFPFEIERRPGGSISHTLKRMSQRLTARSKTRLNIRWETRTQNIHIVLCWVEIDLRVNLFNISSDKVFNLTCIKTLIHGRNWDFIRDQGYQGKNAAGKLTRQEWKYQGQPGKSLLFLQKQHSQHNSIKFSWKLFLLLLFYVLFVKRK